MPWYATHGRHALPWRLTADPYAVLVSEVMLQQTQVDRVLPRYVAWLERWPSVGALAEATVADVIREWSGLGYNRRAVQLHRAAQLIVPDGFPATAADLQALPGVGEYTAAAVASFAFDEHVAVADINIARCVSRALLGRASQRAVTPAAISGACDALLPSADARAHNLALMDLGAMVCQAKTPRCDECPLRDLCEWRRAGSPAAESRPRQSLRFEDTARFARGRIVEALRARDSLPTSEISDLLPPKHRAPLAAYLAALERDGLLVRTSDGDWSLPGERSPVTAR